MGRKSPSVDKGVRMHDEETGDFLAPQNVVDKVVLGRRLRALRVLAGFDRVTDLVTILRAQYGVDVSDRTVYAIERGEQMPHLDFIVAVLAACNEMPQYLGAAVRGDVHQKYMEQRGNRP